MTNSIDYQEDRRAGKPEYKVFLIIANHSSQWVAYESFICVLLINI